MRIKPHVASVVGQSDDVHWGQVLMLPHAYGVVEIDDPIGESRQLGIKVLTTLTQVLSSPPTSLKEVQGIAHRAKGEGITTVLVLVPVGLVVYIALVGSGAVYLKRGEQLACLMDGEGAISGEVQPGDTILLVNGGFTRVLTNDELTAVFDHLSPVEAAEKLTLLLHEKIDGKGSAGLIFQVVATEPLEAEEFTQDRGMPHAIHTAVGQPRPMETVMQKPHALGAGRLSFLKDQVTSFTLPGRRRHLVQLRSRLLTTAGRSNRTIAAVSLILLVIFAVSIFVGLRRQAASTKTQEVTKVLDEAERVFEEGVALLELNPVKGRERLRQAETLLVPLAKTVSPRSKEGRKLSGLYQQVKDNLTLAAQIVRGEPQLFYDLALLKKDARISQLGLADEALALLDQSGRTLYTLLVPSKNGQIVAGGDTYQGASVVALSGEKLYTLTSGGIHLSLIDTKTSKPSIIKSDSQWGKIDGFAAFGGNLYLLDTGKSRIWKYIATETGFTERREYLNPDTLPDLSRATSMAIDGSVWVGTSDGKILRFTQGREDTFVPQGIEPSLGTNLFVYTSDTAKNLYVLDSQNKRVVVLDKDGVYLSQYVWEGEFNPVALVVSESQKKILLVADGKLYSVELK